MSGLSVVQKRAFASAFAAVALHMLILGLWVMVIIIDLPIFAFQPPELEPQAEPEMTVVMIPFVKKQAPMIQKRQQEEPPEKVEQKPEPEQKPQLVEETADEKEAFTEPKQRFARTSADQEGAPDADTDILGERDTRAASELPATPGAKPNTPAQDGVAPLYPGHVETVSKKYQEGSLGQDAQGEESEVPQEASVSKDDALADDEPQLDVPQPDVIVPEEESSSEPKDKHLAVGEELPAPRGDDGDKQIAEDPKEEKSPRERPNDGAHQEADKKKIVDGAEQEPKKGGFRGYSRQTRVTGSINRQGKSALNVKNSPLGRYQALISKAVELQWRRNCEQHRDHIVPGVISIRFYVDQSGGVSGIKFQEVIGANFIERGFTQRALRQVELPKMPESVQEELKGESLELIYNFYF